MNSNNRKRLKASFKWRKLLAKRIHSLERNTLTILLLAVTSSVVYLKMKICFRWLNSKIRSLTNHLRIPIEPAIITNQGRNTNLDLSLSQMKLLKNACRTTYHSVAWIVHWRRAKIKMKKRNLKHKLSSDQLHNWTQTKRNRNKFSLSRNLKTWCQCLNW